VLNVFPIILNIHGDTHEWASIVTASGHDLPYALTGNDVKVVVWRKDLQISATLNHNDSRDSGTQENVITITFSLLAVTSSGKHLNAISIALTH
jgi:hypothetical protein